MAAVTDWLRIHIFFEFVIIHRVWESTSGGVVERGARDQPSFGYIIIKGFGIFIIFIAP